MADSNIFYAIDRSEHGSSIPATFLQVDGAYVVDPNTYRSSGTILYKDATQLNPLLNPNHYLVVPASYTLQNSIDYANNLLASLPPLTASSYNVEPEGEAAARFVLMNSKLLLDWLPNGPQDLQTHYNGAAGDFVQSFQDAASFAYGAVTALLGYSFEEATAYAGAGNVASHLIQYVQYKLGDNNTKVKFDGDNGFDAENQAIADVGYNLAIINKTGPIIKADASDEQSSKFTQNSDSSIQYTATLTGQSQPDVINLDPSGNPTLINLVLSDGSSSSLAAGSSGGPTLASVTDGAGHTIQLSLDVTAPVDVSRLGPAVRAGQAFDLEGGVFGGAATDAPYSSIDGLPVITSDSGTLKEDALGVGRTVLGTDYRVATVTIGSTTASFSSTSLQPSITIRVPDSTDPSIKIIVEGGASNNTIYAGDGNETIFGGGVGNNTIYGNSKDQSSVDVMIGGGGDGAAADVAIGASPSENKPDGVDSFYAYSDSNIMIGGNHQNVFLIDMLNYQPKVNLIWGDGGSSEYNFESQANDTNYVEVLYINNPTVTSIENLSLSQFPEISIPHLVANISRTIIINPTQNDVIRLNGVQVFGGNYQQIGSYSGLTGEVDQYGYVGTNGLSYGLLSSSSKIGVNGTGIEIYSTQSYAGEVSLDGFNQGDFGINFSGEGPSLVGEGDKTPVVDPSFFTNASKTYIQVGKDGTTLSGGNGNQFLDGSGNTTYDIGAGNGQVTVDNTVAGSGTVGGTVVLDSSFDPASVSLSVGGLAGQDLIIANQAGDSADIINELADVGAPVTSVSFSDGTALNYQQIISILETASLSNSAIYGDAGPNVLDGHGSATFAQGGGGRDTFVFNVGYGQLEINETDTSLTPDNTLQFGLGITAAQLQASSDGSSNLYLTDGTPGDQITLDNELGGVTSGVQTVAFSDGTSLTKAQLIALETTGVAGSDQLYGSTAAEIFDGKGGGDYENGGGGGDTFIFNRGYGHLEINEADTSVTPNNTLQFGAGITATQLQVTKDGSGNVYITDGIGDDQVQIDNQLNDPSQGVQAISFADGTHWTSAQLVAATQTDLGPSTKLGSLTIGREQTTILTVLVNSLVTPGISGDMETITSVKADSGQISLRNTGEISYTAPSTSSDAITYTVADQLGNTSTGMVSVTVDPGPIAGTLSSMVSVGASVNLTTAVLGVDLPGLQGDTLMLVGDSAAGTLGTVSLANGQLTYSATGSALLAAVANGPATDSFGYTVSDQYGDTASNTVTLTVAGAVASVLAGPTYGGGSIQVPIGTTTVNAFYFGNTVYDSGDNTVNAGQGSATVYVGSGNVVVNLAGYGNLVAGFNQSGPGAAAGADGNVTISGSQGSSTVQLGNGQDSVILAGYSNAVTLGNGSDAVVAGQGNDTVTLGNGSDHVTIDGYGDIVVAGNGANAVVGGQGSNSVTLGNGADTVSLAGYGNIILLGDGQDTITSGTGGAQVTVGNGNDTINLQGYSNLVRLGSGSDVVNAASYDTVMLNGTNLSLSGGTGETVFLGGNGTSVNDLSSGTSIVASYGSGSATISNFATDSGSVLDLKGGLGSYGTAASVVSALQTDGHGGTLLALGSGPGAASIDFLNTQASMLTVSHFQIG